jgi:hypothetical protein
MVPPVEGPETGSIDETTGAVNVNIGPMPEPLESVVTTAGPTVLVPRGATPATQSMWDALRQVYRAHETPASVTDVTSEPETPSPVPAITIVFLSTLPRIRGDTKVILGAAAYVTDTATESPCTVEIVTGTGPVAVAPGVKTITCELDIQATIDALTPATSTWVTWVDTDPKKDPVKVRGTPPESGTTDGATRPSTGLRKGVMAVVPAETGDIPTDVLNRSV